MNLQNRKIKVERLQSNFDGLTKKIDNLIILQTQLKAKLGKQKSLMIIEENVITLKDVLFSSSLSKQWVGHFDNLEKHLHGIDEDKYCEFNGFLYKISDARDHVMTKNYGRYEDLK